jgi:hypothetical protein
LKPVRCRSQGGWPAVAVKPLVRNSDQRPSAYRAKVISQATWAGLPCSPGVREGGSEVSEDVNSEHRRSLEWHDRIVDRPRLDGGKYICPPRHVHESLIVWADTAGVGVAPSPKGRPELDLRPGAILSGQAGPKGGPCGRRRHLPARTARAPASGRWCDRHDAPRPSFGVENMIAGDRTFDLDRLTGADRSVVRVSAGEF